ncbi:MAG: glutathione S-transferase family protein [Alphaproteobacteria bacterium TMED89]|nr:glutathione S-transferase [Rhodospirillaceae bacterium]RPH13021.1 MAG: glutathione S-transferase family protein [Alphaproteobacteria bacterium TMED89]
MIDLYTWPTPNGWKIHIMLEECGLEYRPHAVNIGKGEQHEPDFLAISPNNRIPAIVDHDGPGGKPLSVFESGAILIYLAEKAGKFYSANLHDQTQINQWLMWQMGGVGPMLGQNHHFVKYAPEQIPYAQTRYINETRRLYGVADRQLANNAFLAGDQYTIADIACYGWMSLWEGQKQDIIEFPHVARWLDTLSQRPGVQRGMALFRERRQNFAKVDTAQEQLFGNKPS